MFKPIPDFRRPASVAKMKGVEMPKVIKSIVPKMP
jgi:hypothetical protein